MRSRKKFKSENPIGTAFIESIDQEGRGVAHVDGKAIFIRGALPNETVTYQSSRVKTSYEFADTKSVIKASNLRVTPKCAHFGMCGGCALRQSKTQKYVAPNIWTCLGLST